MTNHVRLFGTPARADSATRMMQSLGRRCVQYVNKTYKRSGTLWEGRYKANRRCRGLPVRVYRYIELNPVRAGMVAGPAHYPWSSFRANTQGKASDLLWPHALFNAELEPAQIERIRQATNLGHRLQRRALRGTGGGGSGEKEQGRPASSAFAVEQGGTACIALARDSGRQVRAGATQVQGALTGGRRPSLAARRENCLSNVTSSSACRLKASTQASLNGSP